MIHKLITEMEQALERHKSILEGLETRSLSNETLGACEALQAMLSFIRTLSHNVPTNAPTEKYPMLSFVSYALNEAIDNSYTLGRGVTIDSDERHAHIRGKRSAYRAWGEYAIRILGDIN